MRKMSEDDYMTKGDEQYHQIHDEGLLPGQPKYFFSNVEDPTVWAKPTKDFFFVVLIPRKWWSWTAWKLAMEIKKHVGFLNPGNK